MPRPFFVDVILPIPLKQVFTYSINNQQAQVLKQGMRVAVPFGKTKIYTAIVFAIHNELPIGYQTKEIDQLLDDLPIVNHFQIKLWKWIANYYMCAVGEVMRAALPNAFLLESETLIKLSNQPHHIDIKEIEKSLSDDEFLVFEALQHQSSIHINDVRSILDRKNVVSVIKKLLEKKMIEVQEEVFEKYIPKLKRYIKIKSNLSQEEPLKQLLEKLLKAPKQKHVIMTLLMLMSQEKKPIESLVLQKKSKASSSVLKSLINKGILEEYYIQKDRNEYENEHFLKLKKLSNVQNEAYDEIRNVFKKQDVALFYGVTSSGKTEVYVKIIEKILKQGKQVLYMLPEIALTAQLIKRLQFYFGDKISVYHSRYSIHERVEVWKNVFQQKSKAQLIVGARSSIFLPFQDLGLIIIDEEHEPSYKQYNPAPRYHGRDTAIVLSKFHQAKVLMGSATPSIESFYNAQNKKYGLITLKERYGNVKLPSIELIDIKEKYKKKQMTGHFSDTLLENINEVIAANEQVILFQNRRGYSPVVECTVCGVSPQCTNCDVSLTYHQFKNQLRCHYCGYHTQMIQSCMACGSQNLDTKGLGTQQIEEELIELFPKLSIARMDQDTTKKKHGHAKIISAFENKEIDILVGTQMLAKGLDFRDISLVGVLQADNLLNFPDFRAHERSFQLLIQVSGRAGRSKKRGKVLIQTFNPYHQILQQVSMHQYEEMFEKQLQERYTYKYPPYFKIIKITFKERQFKKMQKASFWFVKTLRLKLEANVLGPEAPAVGRVKNLFITNVLIKIPKNQSLTKTKEFIHHVHRSFNTIKEFSSVRVLIDVDSY